MRSLARWGALPLAAWPLGSMALGLDDIETNSYLNQPLNAEIPLTATPDELSSLRVTLAPVSEFTSRGIAYPALLNSIRFEIGRNAVGEDVVFVRSTESIAEPFVTLVVQATTGRSSFMREMTVLLDPPLFIDAPASEPITAPATREPAPAVAGGAIQRPAPAPAQAPQPSGQSAATAQAPAASQAPAAAAPPPAAAADGSYTVQNGDTLWRIAQGNRPSGATTNQAMIAIFTANPQAFDGNINLLRRGAILRIPPVADFTATAAATASAEVQRQMAAWQAGADAAPRVVLLPPSEDAASTGAALGAGGDAADSGAVAALESEVTTLRSELESTRAELAEAERLLELRSAELADLQSIAGNDAAAAGDAATAEAEAEPLFVDETAGADAAADAAAAAGDDAAAEAAAAEAAVAAAAAETETETETAAEPAQAATSMPGVTTASEPSLVDTVLDTVMRPVVWIGFGIGVLVIGALAFLRRRRDEEEDVTGQWEALEAEIDEEADHAATARLRARAIEPDMVVVEGHGADPTAEERGLSGTAEIAALSGTFDDIGEFEDGTAEIDALTALDDEPSAPRREPSKPADTMRSQTLSSQTVINLDQADPIAEADFHMAYGLYDQAADLIARALEADPDNEALQLKLLEVYFVWGNKEQFLESAQSFRGALAKGRDWDKVVIMGKQICPDEPLFSEATAAAGDIDLDLAAGDSAGLDFAFEDESGDAADLDFADGGLEIESSAQRAARTARDTRDDSSDEDAMLDIGERTQAGLEAALLEDADDEAGRTTPGVGIGDLDATQESPTVETHGGGFDDGFEGLTIESPTVEAEGPDAPTVETPTIESPAAHEGDTVEQQRPAAAASDMTAEIDLDDLGLDVGDLENLAGSGSSQDDDALTFDLGDDDSMLVEQTGAADDDDDLLSATGVTQVLHDQDEDDDDFTHTGTAILSDEDATMMAPGFEGESTGVRTAVLEQSPAEYELNEPDTEDDLDLNLDDFSSALDGGSETVEQPMARGFGNVDLDVGLDLDIDDDTPTGTEEFGALDPQTMTEVGTKLDLARAYIDMGDPEGAKSILEEVLSEGDSGQRSEAQALIDALPA